MLKEMRESGFYLKGKKDGDIGEMEARSEVFFREGTTKKDFSEKQQNSQREAGQNPTAINSTVSGRSTNYPELFIKSAHESEFRVHFYVTNLSAFFPKMEVYKKLFDILQNFGETKEIAFQKTSDDSCDFAVGMKQDKTALEIIERNKLNSFLSSFERGEMKPFVEIGSGFKAYVDIVLKGNKRQQESHSRRYNDEKYSHRDERSSPPRSREDKYDKRHQRREHSPHHHSRFSDRGASRSRSRSKSPTRYSDRKRDHEKSHHDRDRDRKGSSQNHEPDYHRQEKTPSFLQNPPGLQVQAMNYQNAMTQKNTLPSYLEANQRFDNSITIPIPGQKKSPFVMSQQIDAVLGSDNYCCFLGLPSEITEKQVLDSLKAQNFELPIEVEPVQEGVMHYLKLGFKSEETVRDLIFQDVYVGPTIENLIFPVLVLPLIRDKKVDELLVHHQVQVESSIPVDALFLGLFYDPYGMMVDCIDMKPTKHVLIFAKQRYAERVLAIPNISLEKDDVEIVMQHSLVDNCYPLLRKNLESQLQSILSRYIKDAYSENNSLSLSPNKEQPAAESKELIEEVKEPEAPVRITQPMTGIKDPVNTKKNEKNEDPQQHYEEMYYAAKQPSGYIHEKGNSHERDQGQYHYHEEPGGRREFPRSESPNYHNNPRYIPGERGGHRGARGPRGNRGGGGFHYQRGGRGQDPRHGQYPPQQHYHQNRQKGPRNVERGTDYRN